MRRRPGAHARPDAAVAVLEEQAARAQADGDLETAALVRDFARRLRTGSAAVSSWRRGSRARPLAVAWRGGQGTAAHHPIVYLKEARRGR